MFLSLGIMMFFAEKINEYLAAQKWLSTQNYFDSSGMFFTCAVAIPVKGQNIIAGLSTRHLRALSL
jgi:hypothetical protein